MLQAVEAAGFFVSHENKTQRKLGGNALGKHFFRQQQHADDGLLVVFHAASVQKIALAAHLPGIAGPRCEVARRHYVRMPEKPEGAAAFAGDAGHKVGTLTIGNARVRRVNA